MKKSCLTLLGLSHCLLCFADEASTDPNPQSRFGTKNSSNFFLSGEIIFIQSLNPMACSATQSDGQEAITYFANHFKPGIRFCFGYNTNYDGWETTLTYTGFRYKHEEPGQTNLIASTLYQGNVTYINFFDQGDLDLARMYKLSKTLHLRPHFGIRGLALTDKNNTLFFDSSLNEFRVQEKIQSRLIGLSLGLDSSVRFSNSYSFYGKFTTALLLNQEETKLRTILTQETITKTKPVSSLVPGFDLAFGFQWDKNFANHSYHIAINAGYEMHSLINFNTLLQELSNPSILFQNQSPDYTYQGIALGVRLDF